MFLFFIINYRGRGNAVQSRVSSPSLRPTLSFPPCQRALPFGIPDWFYGEGVLSAMFLCKFAFRKLVADRDKIMSVRPIHPVRLAPFRTVPLHRAGQYLCTERGSTSAPNEVCTRTRTRRICYPFPASSPPCKDSCI